MARELAGVGGISSRHILLVEDNPDGRETLRALLELLGHRVEVAADGVEGIQKAIASRPEVVLTDIGLPGIDGFQVARQLRATLGRRLFLIALTAYGQPEDRRRAAESGFDVFLVKPVDLSELAYWLAQAPPKVSPSRSGTSGGSDGSALSSRYSSSGSTGLERCRS
jgi:CheY-like chemotaxis protein